jgi:hypothetical protein
MTNIRRQEKILIAARSVNSANQRREGAVDMSPTAMSQK